MRQARLGLPQVGRMCPKFQPALIRHDSQRSTSPTGTRAKACHANRLTDWDEILLATMAWLDLSMSLCGPAAIPIMQPTRTDAGKYPKMKVVN
jgi:hypothetical protein